MFIHVGPIQFKSQGQQNEQDFYLPSPSAVTVLFCSAPFFDTQQTATNTSKEDKYQSQWDTMPSFQEFLSISFNFYFAKLWNASYTEKSQFIKKKRNANLFYIKWIK